MSEGRIDIRGWQVAEAEPYRGFGGYDYLQGGRLFLFRTAIDWTLLGVRTRARFDETDHPVEGTAWVRASTYTSLEELRADLVRDETEDWRALVKSGAGQPYYDPDLMRLWTPVEIDQDLTKSSVYRRDLGARSERRQEAAWREEALGLAVARLEEIGFVVFRSEVEIRKVFPRGLGGEWSNPLVGAVVAARLGHRVRLVVAIDGAGEVYTRSPDTSFTPGDKRRYPPQPLTDRELELAEEIRRQRRPEARGQAERSDDQ